MSAAAIFTICLVVFVVLMGGLTLGMYEAGIWFQNQDAINNTRITQHGLGAQTGDQQQLTSDIQAFQAAQVSYDKASGALRVDIHTQMMSDANDGCAAAAKILNLPAADATWVRTYCLNGAYKQGSLK